MTWMNGAVALLAGTALAACGDAPQAGTKPYVLPLGCWRDAQSVPHCPTTAAPPAPAPEPEQQRVLHVPLTQSNGVYYLDVGISDTCCFKMVLNSGAADVSVPIQLWYAMLKAGLIFEADHVVARYRTANGTVEGMSFVMPPMTVNGHAVEGVEGAGQPRATPGTRSCSGRASCGSSRRGRSTTPPACCSSHTEHQERS